MFNLTSLVDSVALEEPSGNLPEFVRELQNISNDFPINHELPTIDEIQKHLRRLKSGKTSNDVDPERLKKCEHPLMLQVIDIMANSVSTVRPWYEAQLSKEQNGFKRNRGTTDGIYSM